MVLLPAVGAGDLDPERMPQFRFLAEHGAVGLMNTRTATLRWDAPDLSVDPARGSAYLTLGAGTRCAVGRLGAEGYARSERMWDGVAEPVYHRRNLEDVSTSALQLDPRLIRETNANLGYKTEPGALGEMLHRAGMRVSVLGDADRPGEVHREGVLAGMDTEGRVDFAAFGLSTADPAAPFGRAMSLSRLESALTSALSRSDFVVVDWGDTARLDDQRSVMLPDATKGASERSQQRLDALLGLLRRKLDFHRDTLLIVAPYPSRSARASFDLLTPVLMVGPKVHPGWLSSPTTRREGVVANVDVAPTLASILRLAPLPSSVVGRAMVARPAPAAWDRLMDQRARLLGVEAERRNLLSDLIALLTWSMACFALLFFIREGQLTRWIPLTLLLIPASLPLALFLLAYFAWGSLDSFGFGLVILVLALSALCALVARKRGRGTDAAALMALLTVALVVVDGLRHFPHMPYCILSYSLMEGARYYGLGNEYMGAFLSATTLTGTAFFTSRRTLKPLEAAMIAGLFLLSVVILAGPSYGAKFGGAVASAGGFGFCLLRLSGKRLGMRHLLLLAAAVASAIALMVAFDLMRGGGSTHVGRTYLAIRQGGWEELQGIIQRKAGMNLRLLQFSPWSRLMEMGLLATVMGLYSRKRRGLPVWPEGPLGAGIAGAMAAALIAFLVDDAGTLAAATALIFLPPTLAAAEHHSLAPGKEETLE